MKVIYIAGYGRSGSTILEMALSTIPGFRALGEVMNLTFAPPATCECGADVRTCPFWSQVHESDPLASGSTVASLMDVLATICPDETLIDSSKTTRGSRRRADEIRMAGYDVSVIHLVRDPVRVLASVARGRNRDLTTGRSVGRLRSTLEVFRAAAGWVAANRIDLTQFPSRAVLYFEQLSRSPQSTVDASLQELGVAARFDMDRRERTNHAIAGNRVRRGGYHGIAMVEEPEPPLTARILGRLVRAWAHRRGLGQGIW